MKRAFLILLVMVLLLISAAVQGAAAAFPGGEEKFMGCIPLWDLRVAIPCGVFAAAELVIAMGVGAQVLLGLQRVSGVRKPEVDYRLRQLLLSSLWCGWTLLACCTTALETISLQLGWWRDTGFGRQQYINFSCIGAGAMLLCYVMDNYLRGRLGVVPGCIALAVGVAAGLVWHQGYVEFLAVGVLMAGVGLSAGMLVAHWPQRKWLAGVALAGLVLAAVYLFNQYGRAGVLEVGSDMAAVFCVVLGLAGVLAVLRWIRL